MIKTEYCAFCGKNLTETNKAEINGEHIFPAFACKNDFGKSKASSLLQERIKVAVCKECNSAYGVKLEAKLSKIIDGLIGKTPKYSFRTEEALCLLDYIDKTRILLQHSFKDERQKQLLDVVNVDNMQRISPFGRQVFILRADVPDGIYAPFYYTDNCKAFKTKLGYISSVNPADFTSAIAVCIDGIVIVGISNLMINWLLGFPHVMGAPDNQLLYGPGSRYISERLGYTKNVDRDDTIVLAQPGVMPEECERKGIIGEYEKSVELTTKHKNYAYAVYFESGKHKGWLCKNSTEPGAKGVRFDLGKRYSYIEFLELLDFISKIDIMEHVCSFQIYGQKWERMWEDLRNLKFNYTNILATPLTDKYNFIERLQKKYGFERASELINKLNLMAVDGMKWSEISSFIDNIERD